MWEKLEVNINVWEVVFGNLMSLTTWEEWVKNWKYGKGMGGTNLGGKSDDRFTFWPSACLGWHLRAVEREKDRQGIFGLRFLGMTAGRE